MDVAAHRSAAHKAQGTVALEGGDTDASFGARGERIGSHLAASEQDDAVDALKRHSRRAGLPSDGQ